MGEWLVKLALADRLLLLEGAGQWLVNGRLVVNPGNDKAAVVNPGGVKEERFFQFKLDVTSEPQDIGGV